MIADGRDLRLQGAAGHRDRARPEVAEAKAPTLVEAQGIDVVVGGDQPEPVTSSTLRGVLHGRDQR